MFICPGSGLLRQVTQIKLNGNHCEKGEGRAMYKLALYCFKQCGECRKTAAALRIIPQQIKRVDIIGKT